MQQDNIFQTYLDAVDKKSVKNSSSFKVLNKNNIDTNELTGHEKDVHAGEVNLNYKDDKEKEVESRSFAKGALAFIADMPEETIKALMMTALNGADVAANGVGTIFNAMTNVDPAMNVAFNYGDGEKFKTLLNKNIQDFSKYLNSEKEQVSKIGEGSEMNSKAAEFVSIITQDVPYSIPIRKKLKNMGIPEYIALPVAFGIGSAIAFDDDASLVLNSEQVQGFKEMAGVLPDTSEEKIFNTTTRMLEGTAFGFLTAPVIKALIFAKNNIPKYMNKNVEQISTAIGGAAITGSVVEGNIDKSSQTEDPNILSDEKIIPALEFIDEEKEVGDQSAIPGTVNEYGFEKTAGLQSAVQNVSKILATNAGEVIPSLKKLGTKGFIKRTEVNFNKLAEEGKIGKDWYKRSGDNILKYVGGDKQAADQFAQLLAIYSPQKPIPTNTQFAIKAWNRFKSGEKIWDGEILEKAKLPENLNITQVNKFKQNLLAKYGGAKKIKGEKSTGLELADLGDGNLMVVRHGNYENIAEKTKDLKAHLFLNENISWSGRKTNTFYGNIMKEINPELKQGATIDLWMNRAGGFVNQELKDGPKYSFIEDVVNTVAKKKNWDIDQAQAAVWVSTKGRFDKTKSIFSEKALNSGIGIRKGGSVIPVKGKESEFADLRFNTAMDYKVASQDINKAALNFADALEDNLAYVSWETVPGKFSKHLNGLEKASSEIKSEYHFKVSQMLTDDKGTDVIAKKLGILSPGHFEAPGYFQGVTNPSGQTKIATTRIKGAGKDVTTMDAPSQDLLEKYAAIRGLVLSQDAIGYHRLILAASRKNANSVAIKFDKEFTPNQFKKFGQSLDKEFGDGHALISKEKGVLVLNVGDLDNIEFQKRLKNLAENTIENNTTFMYYKNGNLITKEATDYGKSYRDIVEGFQGSDIRQLLRDILSKKKTLDKEFSRKYKFDYDEKAFQEIESFIQKQ